MKKIVIAVMMMAVSVSATAADFGDIVLGALVGGAAGHQFGNGRGKDVATVAGAIVGAKVAAKIVDDGNNSEYQCVENCGGSQYAMYDREAEAAAARGAAARLQREHDRERAYTLRNAYCSQDPEGCRYGRGYAYNSGHPIIWR